MNKSVWDEPIPPSADPCINKCGVDSRTGLCIGCFRNLKEIREWSGLSIEEKREIVKLCEERKNKR